MPLCILLAPAGLEPDAKKQMMKELTAAIEEGYPQFVTEIYLREVPDDSLMVDSVLAAERNSVQSP
jgi:hypothetical protein